MESASTNKVPFINPIAFRWSPFKRQSIQKSIQQVFAKESKVLDENRRLSSRSTRKATRSAKFTAESFLKLTASIRLGSEQIPVVKR